MAAPFDVPQDPETGRVFDPAELAGRRARRAGQEDEDPMERAQRAERMVVALEQRLGEAEVHLATAQRERGALAYELQRIRHELTAALQREHAEQRLRVEIEGDAGALRRDLEEEVARIRVEHEAATQRAAELARALEATREQADAARALADADRERAETELARLRQALEERSAVHDAIAGQITELRGALEGVRERAAAETAAAQAARADATEEVVRLRAALATLGVDAAQERDRREALEDLLAGERARFTAGLAASEAALAAERGRHEAAAADRIAAAEALVEQLREELAHDADALAELRLVQAGQAVRDAAVEQLVAELVAAIDALRAEFTAELETLEAAREEQAQHGADATERAILEARVGELQAELAATGERLGAELEAETAARLEAETRLVREAEERHAAEARAAAANAALLAERERAAGTATTPNPVYDTLTARAPTASVAHPALARVDSADPGGEPPAVVADLALALERLRAITPAGTLAERSATASVDAEPAAELEPPAEAEHVVVTDVEPSTLQGVEPPPDAEPLALEDVVPSAATEAVAPAVSVPPADTLQAPAPDRDAAERLDRAAPWAPPPSGAPWLAGALATLAEIDAATAERLLLAALPVQGLRAGKPVTYEVVLPHTGARTVGVTPGGPVTVTPGAGAAALSEFTVSGAIAALAPLVAGGARSRLPGVAVSGRRRRARRLLRALRAPVGLAELAQAGAAPRPGDLLALLCASVPVAEVVGADFGVAYVVESAGGGRSRTLVRAEPDGSLTAIPEAPEAFRADATILVRAHELLDVLGGSVGVTPDGDAAAAATLQGWLLAVQF